MRKWIIAAGALACAVLTSGSAEAANCATVSFSVPSFPQFDPINGSYTNQTITANLTRVDSQAVTARMILIDNDVGTPVKLGSAGPIYDIQFGGTSQIYPSGTVISQSVGGLMTFSGTSASGNFTFRIPNTTSDFVGGTTYVEPLKYSLQCYKNSGGTGNGNLTSTDSNISAFSASVTILRVVSIVTGSPATINFGSYTTTTQSLNVNLKSTSSVNVTVATANVNQMVLNGAVTPFPTNSTIPYTMTLNGDTIANGSSLSNRTRAGVVGTNWPLILTLTGGLPTGKLAGGYSDTITLTMSPGI